MVHSEWANAPGDRGVGCQSPQRERRPIGTDHLSSLAPAFGRLHRATQSDSAVGPNVPCLAPGRPEARTSSRRDLGC